MQVLKFLLFLAVTVVFTATTVASQQAEDATCDVCVADDACTYCTVVAEFEEGQNLNDLTTENLCLCADNANYDSCADWKEGSLENDDCLDSEEIVDAVEKLAAWVIVIIVIGGLCCLGGVAACIFCCLCK